MNIKKKILAITICPVLVLGIVSMLFINTLVRNSVMDEIEDALKGTAAATLAAYDQNLERKLQYIQIRESRRQNQEQHRHGCYILLW